MGKRGRGEGGREEKAGGMDGRVGVPGALTTLDVEGVVFVDRPSPQLGGCGFVALQDGRPLLPQDEVRTRLVLEAHGHWGRRDWSLKHMPHIQAPKGTPARSQRQIYRTI